MRFGSLTLLPLLIAACSGPSPSLIGNIGQPITVEGGDFIVYVQGNRAEAVRTNFEFPATVRSVFPRAIRAMELVSGCEVPESGVTGDPALIKARLRCG